MAAKFWYVANNGSSNWNTAGVWYNAPGGAGGTTTTPTAADDAYLTTESGTGTLTMSAATACNSLDCTGFRGTLTNSGGFGLTVTSYLVFSLNMTVSHTGLTTITGSAGTVNCGGNSFAGNVTFNNASATFYTTDFKAVSTATVTLTAGTLITTVSGLYTEWALECGLFVSTGTGVRAFWSNGSGAYNWKITGIGTCWNVSGSNITCWDTSTSSIYGQVYFTNSTASTKTITHTLTGNNFPGYIYIGGTGSGTFTISSYLYSVYVTNTGGATIAFGTTMTIVGDLYFDPTSNVNWNSSATTLTFSGGSNITLSPSMTITNSGTISVTGGVSIFSNGKSLIGNVTVNSASSGLFHYDDMKIVGTLTLTAGTIQSIGGDTYASTLSSSNSTTRALYLNDLYLTGTGTLVNTGITINLSVSINNIYVSGSTSVARTLTLNAVFVPIVAVYLGGSGGSTIGLTPGVSVTNVYVTNTGAALISISTSTLISLKFLSGTNAIWSNSVTTQTLTIQGDLSIASSAGTPVLTPNLIFNGVYSVPHPGSSGYYDVFISLGGKSLVTGTVTLNDTAYAQGTVYFNFTDTSSQNSALTITSAAGAIFSAPFSATSMTITSVNDVVTFNSSLTLSAGISIANNANSIPNNLILNGTTSCTTFAHSALGYVYVKGNLTATTSIVISNTSSASVFTSFNNAIITTPTFTVTNGLVTLNGNLTCTGIITLTVGQLVVNGNYVVTAASFAAAGTGIRTLSLGSGTWTITGNTGIVWNVNVTNLTFDGGSATINITDPSLNALTFSGSSAAYYTLQWNRAGSTGVCNISGAFSCVNFVDLGTAAHTLAFQQGGTFTIGNFAVKGSPGNLITLNSQNGVNAFTLSKSPLGVVNSDYLNIQHCIASPSTNTWYAGTNSVNNQAVSTAGSGWIFTNMPPRKLGAGGVG